MKEHFEKEISEFKKILEILPTNTKDNRNKKLERILDEENKNDTYIKEIKNEIEKRLDKFKHYNESTELNDLKMKLETLKIINEWNVYNTPYEKMHLDYYLFHLEQYQNDNLKTINECLFKIVDSFNKVGISLKKEDFNFNCYVLEYMDLIINNSEEDLLKSKFEEIYWTFPDLIKTIEVNFKKIYLKYENNIIKFYKDRHNEYLKKYKDQEIIDLKYSYLDRIYEISNTNPYYVFEKFKNKTFSVSEFSVKDIDNKKNTYFLNNSYNSINLKKLYNTLCEYQLLVKYKYILDDMRERLKNKDSYKNVLNSSLKSLGKLENNLIKLNSKLNSKGGLFKKDSEKLFFDYKEALYNVLDKYKELDECRLNNIIYNELNLNSTVDNIFDFISSNYLYFINETKKVDDSLSILNLTNRFNELKEKISTMKFEILDNTIFLDDKPMKQVIIDKFKFENINITLDNLDPANIDKTLSDLENLINYENILKSGLSIDDISLYFENEKM